MIVIGVTGGIAAYKMCSVVSYLTSKQYDVHVVMTESAKKFVGPITFASLSHNPVIDETAEWTPDGEINHIDYSKCKLLVIAPATANTIAKMAHGIADNVLTSLYLAHPKQALVFPAMNTNMYESRITQDNLSTIRLLNRDIVIEPDTGKLACGDVGKGKFPSTQKVCYLIEKHYITQNIIVDKDDPFDDSVFGFKREEKLAFLRWVVDTKVKLTHSNWKEHYDTFNQHREQP